MEPKFKYVANMHGDETLGRQLVLYLAEYLVQNYGFDERATRIMDSTEVYLMPTMNPDGFARSREGCQGGGGGLLSSFGRRGATGRENANNKDLNRDFPQRLRFNGEALTSRQLFAGRQQETACVVGEGESSDMRTYVLVRFIL